MEGRGPDTGSLLLLAAAKFQLLTKRLDLERGWWNAPIVGYCCARLINEWGLL